MPEFPDVEVYVDRLSALTVGKPLEAVRVLSFFLLRTVEPPLAAFQGLAVKKVSRLGKRIVFSFEKNSEELHLVVHLMIAGRFHWKTRLAPIPKGNGLAAFDFPNGTLILTESGSKKRASLHAVAGKDSLEQFHRGGLEIFESSESDFAARLRLENHTLKRTLTDPTLFSGIGNAYSDEILHRAKLSPILLSSKISDEEAKRLFSATRDILSEWKKRIADETGEGFPEHVTAFREGMAVHGRYEKPCPVCGTKVQRIRYAEIETNYCPECQTGGKLLADRALSRLLKGDWPRTVDELENKRGRK